MKKLDVLRKAITFNDIVAEVQKGCVLIVRGDAHCSGKFDGKYYSALTDPLRESLEDAGICVSVVAKPFSSRFGQSCNDNADNITSSYCRSLLLKKINQHSVINFWKNYLKLKKVRYVIAVFPSKGLCRAAYEMGLPLADLQHGVISEQHPSYGFDFCNPMNVCDLPSEYLLWDSTSREVISRWATGKGISSTVIGHPSFVKHGGDAKLKSKSSEITVLYTLQWGLDRESWCTDYVSFLWSKKIESLVKIYPNYHWIFRIHPAQKTNEDFIFQLIKDRFGEEIFKVSLLHNDLPLFDVLKGVDIHLTYNSSVTIEASWFNIPTLLLDNELGPEKKRSSYYLFERNVGIAKIIDSDVNVIAKAINESSVSELNNQYSFQFKMYSDYIDRLVRGDF